MTRRRLFTQPVEEGGAERQPSNIMNSDITLEGGVERDLAGPGLHYSGDITYLSDLVQVVSGLC